MIRAAIVFITLCLSCVALAAPGDTLYVAERLFLSMTAEPRADSTRVRLLESGDNIVEVSRQGDFIQVRVADGTTGWVRETYVTATAPGSIRAATLQAENAQLVARIAELEAAPDNNATADPRIAELETENDQLRQRTTVLESELQSAQQNALPPPTMPDASDNERLMPWAAGGAVAIFILGILVGFAWRNRQVRQRFHGFDV